MAGSVYGSVYVLKPINRSACGGVVRPRMKRGRKTMTVEFLEIRGSENRREVIRPDKKVTKGEVRTWSQKKSKPKFKAKKKRNTPKLRAKEKHDGESALHQTQVALDTDAIRKKLGPGFVRPDKVEYHRVCLVQSKRPMNAYELRARCSGHWLTVRELMAVDALESAVWGRYSGALRRNLCQTGVLQLMEHYGLEVPQGVRLAAEKAEGIGE